MTSPYHVVNTLKQGMPVTFTKHLSKSIFKKVPEGYTSADYKGDQLVSQTFMPNDLSMIDWVSKIFDDQWNVGGVSLPLPMKYKVLTVKNPYAGLIAIGKKTIETRSWATKYRGDLVIHAAKTPDKQMLDHYSYDRSTPFRIPDAILAHGAFVCVVELVDVISINDVDWKSIPHKRYEKPYGNWIGAQYAWMLKNPRIVAHTPATGNLGIWNWDGVL